MVGYFPTICKTRFLLKTFFRFCISYRLLFGKMKNKDTLTTENRVIFMRRYWFSKTYSSPYF